MPYMRKEEIGNFIFSLVIIRFPQKYLIVRSPSRFFILAYVLFSCFLLQDKLCIPVSGFVGFFVSLQNLVLGIATWPIILGLILTIM